MKKYLSAFLSLILLLFFTLLVFPRAYGGNYSGNGQKVRPGVFNGRDRLNEEVPTVFSKDRSDFLKIPLPGNVREEDITVSENPLKRMVFIRIEGANEDFYKENSFSGSMEGITDLKYGSSEGVFTVELTTDGICIPETEYDGDGFYFKAVRPHDRYEYVVAIDPGHVGSDTGSVVYDIREQDITIGLARTLKEKLDSETVLACILADGSFDIGDSEKADIAEGIDADLLISLHTGADPNTRTTCGVEAYCSPELKRETLDLTEALSKALDQKDLKVSEKKIPGILDHTLIPAVRLKLGYITNKNEALKMNSDEYREKASDIILKYVDEIRGTEGDEQ